MRVGTRGEDEYTVGSVKKIEQLMTGVVEHTMNWLFHMQIRLPFLGHFDRTDRDRNPNRAFVARALTLEGIRPRVTNL